VILPELYTLAARRFLEETTSVRRYLQLDATGATAEGRARTEGARRLVVVERAIAEVLTERTP
jgi:hypothetical protein